MNNGHWILDEDGNEKEVDLMTWATWFETPGNRRVAHTEVDDHFVSTVFLGLDHSFGVGGKPVLYETMTFEKEPSDLEIPGYKDNAGKTHAPRVVKTKKSLDNYSDRYTSREDALAGHERIVNELKNHGTEDTEAAEGI